MKLICDIVQDLLPLYEDGVCSEASRDAIQEHLNGCSSCNQLLESIKKFKEPESPKYMVTQEDKVVVKSFRKVHKRWIASLCAMLLVVPVLILSINEFRQMGICFTNIDEIWIAKKYVSALEQGNVEKAASYMNYEYLYNEIQGLLSMQPQDFEKTFYKVTIDGKEWMITEDCQNFLEEEGEETIWSFLINNMIQDVMIPITVWEESITLQSDDAFQVNADGSYEREGVIYKAIQSEWGTFMVEVTESNLQCTSAGDFCSEFDLIPVEIYEAGKARLKEDALERYYNMQQKYEKVSNMTVADFETVIKERYENQLQECMDLGYSVKMTGFDDGYYLDENGHWIIGYGMNLSYNKKEYPITAYFSVGDGKVRNLGAVGFKGEYLEESEDKFTESLSLSYDMINEE